MGEGAFTQRIGWAGALGLAAALAAGAALRLAWPDDIEWKNDEQWMFERTIRAGRTEPWPRLGPHMSVGPLNPSLSVWTFVGLGRLFGAEEPPQLARAVGLLSLAAIGLLIVFARTAVPPE